MQARVVDALVLHAGRHGHAARLQAGAVDPARGLAQAVAHLAGLALQQVHAARGRLHHRRGQAAGLRVTGVDAPFGVEPGWVDAGAGAVVHQVLAHVEADATRTHHGHVLAHRLLGLQHVQVAQHLGVVDAVDGRLARRDAGGQHDVVVAAGDQLRRIGARVQAQVHALQLDLAPVVAQGFVKLLLARHLLGDVELPADFAGGIEQRDPVPTPGCRGGKGQPRRPGADHGDAARLRGGFDGQHRLVAGARVDQARGDAARKGVVQAGLVAGDAGVDLVGAALARLAHELRIGQKGPRHRHHVAHAIGQQLFGQFGRVDAVGGHQRHLHVAHQPLRDPGVGAARHLGGDGGHARLVPADAGVDDGGARRLDGLRELDHFVQRRAALHQIQHRQPVDDDEVAPHALAHAAHDLDRKADAIGVVAAPFVGAVVGARGDELVDQVALAAHDLHTVVARVLRQRGAAHEVGNRLLHLVARQRVRRAGVDGALDRAGRHQIGVVGVAAKVQDLHGDLAARGVHGVGDDAVPRGLGLGGQHGAAGRRAAALVGGNAAGHDQAHLAARAFGIERGHALEALRRLFQSHVHRAHEHAVAQGGEAQVERGEQVRVGRHGFPLCNWLHECSRGEVDNATGCIEWSILANRMRHRCPCLMPCSPR